MKRSEMVKILMCDISDTEGMTLNDRAEFILSSMLARGLSPDEPFEKDPEYEAKQIKQLEELLGYTNETK